MSFKSILEEYNELKKIENTLSMIINKVIPNEDKNYYACLELYELARYNIGEFEKCKVNETDKLKEILERNLDIKVIYNNL